MTLITSRRSFIVGLTSLVASPSLVRASSLMQLRGENMDPLVLAYTNWMGERVGSMYRANPAKMPRNLRLYSICNRPYYFVRTSEITRWNRLEAEING